ncbi:hypothetical protein BSLG_001699 [Batrachochytrium salamandrivorans]|nr:hypothetical protein BSLG_001699 [Batrachochytrium salamandrivorans]
MHTVGWWIPCVQGIVAFSPSAASAVSVVSAASTNLQPAGCFEIPYQVINPHSVSIQPSFLDYIWIARISSNDNNGSTTDAASHSRISDKAPPGVHDDSGDISGWHPGARLSGKMLILMLSLVGVAVIVALCGVMYMRGRWIAAHNANIMSRRSQIEAKKLPTIIYASMPFMGMQSASNQSIMGKQKQTQTQKRSSSLHGPLALLTGDCSMQSTLFDQSAENDIPSPTPMLDGVMGDLSSVRMSFLSVVLAAPSKAAMNEQTQSHELDPERGLPYGNYDNPIIGIPPVPNSVHVVLHPHFTRGG